MAKKYTRPGKAARLEMLERVKTSYYGLDEVSQISVDKLISKSGYNITGIFGNAGTEALSKTRGYKPMFDILKKYEKVLFKTSKGVKKQKTEKELNKYLSKYDKTLPNWAKGRNPFLMKVGEDKYKTKGYSNKTLDETIIEVLDDSIYKERLQALKGKMRYEDWMELIVEDKGVVSEKMLERQEAVYIKVGPVFDKVRDILISKKEDTIFNNLPKEFRTYIKFGGKETGTMDDEAMKLYKKVVEVISKSKASRSVENIAQEVYEIITHKTRTSARISMK